MNVSFLSIARTVLFVTDELLYIYKSSSKGVTLVETVSWTTESFSKNVGEIIRRKCGEKPILIINDMVKNAHQQGMKVHPYTFRKETSRIPSYASSFENLLDIFLYQIGVDGIFTDFPDLAVKFVKNKQVN